jgi:citrate lyase gamma subunit
LQNGFERTLELLDIIVKQKPHETPKIVVELDTSVQREILEVVKDIQVDVRELKGIVTGGSGISEAAEQALAAQLQSAIGPLQEAIAANQPQGAPKKKKKNNPKQQ